MVELSIENPNSNKFYLKDISVKFFKYYWNQTIYFDLIQGSNLSKPPEVITLVKKEITNYFKSCCFKNLFFIKNIFSFLIVKRVLFIFRTFILLKLFSIFS